MQEYIGFGAIITTVIAIVPAAGKGKRMISVTRGAPKELLALGTKTVLERILDEARTADVDGATIVNARSKPEIDEAIETWSHRGFADLPIRVTYQEEQSGLGHAIAASLVQAEAIVLLGDTVFRGSSPVDRMANLIHRGIDGCLAVELVDDDHVHLYGIVEIDEASGSVLRIVEKPGPKETSSRWAIAARFAFSKPFMVLLHDFCEDPVHLSSESELGLTEIMNEALRIGMEFKAVALQPGQTRIDCGSASEYAAARGLDWD